MDSKIPARIAGGAAGLANGLFGGGGGMVFLPILSRFGGLEQRKLYVTRWRVTPAAQALGTVDGLSRVFFCAGRQECWMESSLLCRERLPGRWGKCYYENINKIEASSVCVEEFPAC